MRIALLALGCVFAFASCANHSSTATPSSVAVAVGPRTKIILPNTIKASEKVLRENGFQIDARTRTKLKASRVNNSPFYYTDENGVVILVKSQDVLIDKSSDPKGNNLGIVSLGYNK